MLACSFAAHAQAQKPAPRHTQVGAADIFAALTQPDHQAELEALQALRGALSGSPDPEKLEAARAKLAEVLQAEERHQADMPPALVMSGISSRIEAAMAGLEEARHAPKPAPDPWQALLVPGLAAVSAALGVALIASLAGFVARGRQAEEQEELQDTLKKIRRRLEGGAPSAATGGLAQEMASGEASEAVHQATIAVDRLGSAARDAEGRLQTSVSDAEARLHAAATMAGQLEQWMESLPDRLAASVQAMESHGLPGIDAAAARIEESAEKLAGLQDLLADYGGAVSGLTAQAERSAEHLQHLVSAMHERFDTLAGTLPERIAGALPAAMSELNSAADLLAELSTLAIGQTFRLEDIVARADKVAYDLPAVAQLLEAASAHLLGQIDQDAKSSGAAGRMAEDLAEMSRLARAAAESLPERLAGAAATMEARLADGAGRVQAQLEAASAVAGETLSGQVAKAAEAVVTRFSGRAELLQAGLEQAALAVAHAAAALPEVSDGLREAAAQLTNEAGGQAAALRQAAADLAAESATLRDAARAHVPNEGETGAQASTLPENVLCLAQDLQGLTTRLEMVLGSAEALHAQAAQQAEAAQARDAEQVTTLFEVLAGRAEACLSALPSEAAALAATAAQLRGDAAELAASAMRIDGDARSPDQMPAQAGAALTALQSVCQRLEETLAAFGETGVALSEGVARIGREVLQLEDGSASAQAALAASAAAMQDAGARLGQVVAIVQAAEPAAVPPGNPAVQDVQDMQAQLAVLTARLAELLEDYGERSAQRPQSPPGDLVGGRLLDTLQAQAERMAAVLDRNEQLAERLADAVADRPVQDPDTLAAAQPALIGLQAATETVQRAAARLLESAQAQDAALARAGQAAADVARLVAAPTADMAEGHGLAGLNGLASLAESLQGEAESLAACVLRGDTLRIPAELISQTPVMLAAIETSIHRLRGTATALALASDGRLKAA